MITATTAFLAMLCVGMIVLLRNYKPDLLNKVLIGIIAYWIVLFTSVLIEQYSNADSILNMTCLLEYRRMYSGMIALFIYMLYPVIAIFPRFFFSPNILMSLIPFAVSCGAYNIWCHMNGVDASYHFTTFDNLMALENRTILLFRLAMFVSFYIFFVASLYSFRRITILYQKYIDGVYSDAEYNIQWLKKYVWSMALIGAVYSGIAAYTCMSTYWLYIVGATINFMVLIDNALKYKQFERSKEYEVCWNIGKGWHVERNNKPIEELPQPEPTAEDHIFKEFEEWMRSVESYELCNFTLNEVKERFPDLDYYAMDRQLTARGHTFQSYIRKMRIERAMEIIKSSRELSMKEVGFKAGFTNSSSFGRAFLAEVGCTPGEYRAKLHGE